MSKNTYAVLKILTISLKIAYVLVRLAIHSTKKPPVVDNVGIDLEPNTLARVALQQTNISRQPAPYASRCSSVWEGTYSQVAKNNPNLPYSIVVRSPTVNNRFSKHRFCGNDHFSGQII